MDPTEQFERERLDRLDGNAKNERLTHTASSFLSESIRSFYSYNFEWLSRPIIQYPQDIVAIQELIWQVRPDLIVETGIAHGGSLILSASMLALLDYCDAAATTTVIDPRASGRRVIGIDIDIRPHNRRALEAHPLAHKIELLQGSSISPEIVTAVRQRALGYQHTLVLLDSNHTHDHVLAELEAYGPIVSLASYCVVFDTVIEHMSGDSFHGRPWRPGNSPMTAVNSYLSAIGAKEVCAADGKRLAFEIDGNIDNKLMISVAPRGYLRRVST